MVDDIVNSDSSTPISRRKNLISGVDDAHLALGGVGLALIGLGVVSWPSIQDWISKTFKMPPPNGAASPANGQAAPQQPIIVPPPPAVLPQQQQQQPQPEQKDEQLPYPYLRRQNIAPVGQAVSVSAMETVPDQLPAPPQQQPPKKPQQQGYYSPFGASISGEVG